MTKNSVPALQAQLLQLRRDYMLLREEFTRLRNSRSWRITAPLRFLAERGRALRACWRSAPPPQPERRSPLSCGIARRARNWRAHVRTLPVLGGGKIVSLWTARQGNAFFHEIAHLLVCSLREAGIPCASFAVDSLEDCLRYTDATSVVRLIIAPHEFFHFIPEAADCWPQDGARLWLLNSEQQHTPWFASASAHFEKADLILDMDSETADYVRSQGFPAEHIPLLHSPSCRMFDGFEPIPKTSATEGLPKCVRLWACSADPLGESLVERPLDYCFFGVASERRSRFFARNAALFAEMRTYLRLEERHMPLVYGENSSLSTQAVSSIVRRSKIVINIHQSENLYFEWHRILLQGIWQGATVVSEPCTASYPFRPDEDYVSASLEDMPAVLEFLLRSDEGRLLAEKVRRHAWQTLLDHPLAQRWESIFERYGFTEESL